MSVAPTSLHSKAICLSQLQPSSLESLLLFQGFQVNEAANDQKIQTRFVRKSEDVPTDFTPVRLSKIALLCSFVHPSRLPVPAHPPIHLDPNYGNNEKPNSESRIHLVIFCLERTTESSQSVTSNEKGTQQNQINVTRTSPKSQEDDLVTQLSDAMYVRDDSSLRNTYTASTAGCENQLQ